VGVSSMSHCDGLKRLTMNRVTLTATKDTPTRSIDTWRTRPLSDADSDVGQHDTHPDVVV